MHVILSTIYYILFFFPPWCFQKSFDITNSIARHSEWLMRSFWQSQYWTTPNSWNWFWGCRSGSDEAGCFLLTAVLLLIPLFLLNCLWNLEISGCHSICNWILDFLSDRPQVVKIGNHTSSSLVLNMGVPQGCVVSPLLNSRFYLWLCCWSRNQLPG